jgi:hypothetical protein
VLAAPAGERRAVRVSLDGRPLVGRSAGHDVRGGRVGVDGQRLYRLVNLARVERHVLTLHLEPGVSAYAFTFG